MPQSYGHIVGWGKYVPEKVLTNADLAAYLDTSDEWIVARSGIRERHIAAEDENTSDMAIRAARDAIEMAGIAPSDLDLIIVATSSPDYLTPPISSQVQAALGAEGVAAFTLTTGCTGFVYGLATAQQFIGNGSSKNVLVVGAELISRWVDYSDRATCILFGDGAGAVVLQASEEPGGVLSFELGSDGSKGDLLIVPAGGVAILPSLESLAQDLHYVKMNGRAVFKFATRIVGRALAGAMAGAGLEADDIDLFIPHQANVRIIDAAARYVGLPEEKVYVNIDRYGNTSAASIPIAFCEAIERGRIRPGDNLGMVAFGAGLTWAAAVVKMAESVLMPEAEPELALAAAAD
jgi:3-oxoacyl-[acyl-carrier-protein] synthase-3